jgi:hypothetical protein
LATSNTPTQTPPEPATPEAPKPRAKRNDGATVRKARAATPAKRSKATTSKAKASTAKAATVSKENVGTVAKHDRRVDQLMGAVRKVTKLPVSLSDSTMDNRLVLKVGGATAAWLWLSRGQLNAFSSRTGLDIKGVGVGTWTMAKSAQEVVKKHSASPGRAAGTKATPKKGGRANGNALVRELQASVRQASRGKRSGASRTTRSRKS